ncbi:MAG: methionyl-tRNA formyltransferase [Actinobacteria bacterium]|nr:methionyl-tRNA formyltransferase [Actinomycetota bacterium]
MPQGEPNTGNDRPAVVFAGSGEFSADLLRELARIGFLPAMALTRRDRPAGRGRRLRPTPLKAAAAELGVEVVEADGPSDPAFMETLEALRPEVLLVADYGFILPKAVLSYPSRGCVNVHPSLLPRHRGAAPIRRALMEGDSESGVSLMLMDEGLDTGPIIAASAVAIEDRDNELSLRMRLAATGADLVARFIPLWVAGDVEPCPQGEEGASYAPPISPEELLIDWALPSREIHNRVRALAPRPGAHTFMRGKRLKVLRSEPCRVEWRLAPGEVSLAESGALVVGTGEGALRLLELKPEGKRSMLAEEFLRGYRPSEGEILGPKAP